MPSIRPAVTREDRLAVLEVAHAANRPEAPLEHFQALRLHHARRALATWWLLEEEGRALSSLVCHPLDLALDDAAFPAYGLGAVATRPEARREGHAERLCRAAIDGAEAQGRRVGLLYSAIPPAYYERMGFRELPAHRFACDRLADLAASGPRARLHPLDPQREAAALAEAYERAHAGRLHVRRDAGGMERSLSLGPADLFFGVGDPWSGFARVSIDGASLDVVEMIVGDEDHDAVVRALAHLATRLSLARVEGWYAAGPQTAPWFVDEGRAKTLPMLRGFDPPPPARFWDSDYF